jgi:hypothetical protein
MLPSVFKENEKQKDFFLLYFKSSFLVEGKSDGKDILVLFTKLNISETKKASIYYKAEFRER